MRKYFVIALSVVVGAVIGIAGSSAINAQTTPPAYFIGEIDVVDSAGYRREYLPMVEELTKAHGGHLVAAGGAGAGIPVFAMEGEPPKRVIVYQYPNMDALQAWHDDARYRKVQNIGERFATFRTFAVEATLP